MEDLVWEKFGAYGLKNLAIKKGEKLSVEFKVDPMKRDVFSPIASKELQRAFIKGENKIGITTAGKTTWLNIHEAIAHITHGEKEMHVKVEGSEQGVKRMLEILGRIIKSAHGE